MRRSVGRLLPRLLAGASEASLVARQGEACLMPRLAAAASGGQHVAASRSFNSSAAACSSSLAEALKTELEYERENYTKVGPLAVCHPAARRAVAVAVAVAAPCCRAGSTPADCLDGHMLLLWAGMPREGQHATAPTAAPLPPLAPPQPEELAAGRPPGGFDLSDAEGDNLLTLSKQLPSGERVTIDVLVDEQVRPLRWVCCAALGVLCCVWQLEGRKCWKCCWKAGSAPASVCLPAARAPATLLCTL